MDAYMGLPYRNYSNRMLLRQRISDSEMEKMLTAKRDTINSKPKTALPLNDYTGEYIHELYGRMNIKLEKGELIMRFEHHPNRYSKLEALGGNRFLSTWNDPLYGVKVLPFTIENARPDDPVGRGKVRSLTVRVADFVEFTPYEFIKAK